MSSLKDFVISHANAAAYYVSRFPQWNEQYHPNVICPFHSDSKPSLSLNLKRGGARCHASTCAVRIGNIVHFESKLKGITEKKAAQQLYVEFGRKVISRKIVQQFRENLLVDGLTILRIKKELGLTNVTLKKFSIGYNPISRRITIPIYDQFDNCINIRFYKLPSQRNNSDDCKIHNYGQGYGTTDLFPLQCVKDLSDSEPIYLMASETETMLARQDGYEAFCSTTGEGTWSADWEHLFKARPTYTVYDRDDGGDAATKKVHASLIAIGARPSAIILPFRQVGPDRKDYRDWRLKENGSPKNLSRYANRSKEKFVKSSRLTNLPVPSPVASTPKKKATAPTLPDFASDKLVELASIGSSPKLLNKRVRTQGIVAAKASNTYSIPWEFNIEVKSRPAFTYRLPFGRELLRFVKTSDQQILQQLQELLGNEGIKVTPLSYITATEVEVIPIAVVDKDVPYVTQRCYYFGPDIKANVPYMLEVIPTSEIRSQETVGIITYCEAVSKSVDRFELTSEIETELKGYFNPNQKETSWQKLNSLANEISNHYTHVVNRVDWHMVALLTWASPLQLRFPDSNNIERGWLNSLALGDTETGKSKVAKAIQRITGAGVFVNSEHCTLVGLIGGAIKMGSGQLMLRWGRIPLSDKQLVILEELSGLSVEEISNMSDVRSSGVARLDKGGINSQTNSRTRLLCLSNVRSARKNLSNYLYGVHAIQELVGHGEDIARFDLITTLVDNEVSIDTINSNRIATVASESNVGLELAFKNLIHYIWALGPDEITFSEDAWNECLEQTKKLSAIYYPGIPVFKGGSGRYKLGRIAASIACIQFSQRDDKIVVLRAHVKAAARLLKFIYDKPSFGYKQYSEQCFDREELKNTDTLAKTFRERISSHLPEVLESLIHATKFNRDELCAIAGIPIFHADQVIGALLRSAAIRKEDGPNNIWAITPAGKTWLEQLHNKTKPKQNGTRH